MKKKLEWFFDFAKRRRRTLFIMKNLVLLIFVMNLQVSASVFSQQKVTLELKDATLKECLKAIEKQTDLGFLYNGRELSRIEGISVNADEEDVADLLESLLAEQGYSFVIENDVILIRKAEVIEEIKEATSEQQEDKIVIRGTVSDENGDPLPFAAVCFKGTTTGCVSAVDGAYELEAPNEEGLVLEISSLGFITQEIPVEGRTTINIVLVEDVKGLDEVVVTGYQTLSRERATGSFDKMNTEHMERPSSTISERLVGSLAGVNSTVNADGSISFEIRGQTSLLADAQPLVVVDGFPVVQSSSIDPFSNINPNDVESITILKDAAAASIWGAKAANGVIVITTKKGKQGKAKVEFSSFWKLSSMADLDYAVPLANSAETIEYEKMAFDNTVASAPFFLPGNSVWHLQRKQSQAVTLMNEHRLGNITEAQLNSGLNALENLNNKEQIRDNLMQRPFTQQYNLSITGGNDIFSNALSIMYEDSKSNYKGDEQNRAMVNFRNKTAITKWLDFTLNSSMQQKNKERNGLDIANTLQPYDMLLDANGGQTNLNHLYYYTPILNSDQVPTEEFPHSDWSYNPIQEQNERDFTTKELNARIQAGLNFKLLQGLTFDTKISYEYLINKSQNTYNENSFAMRRMVNETSSWMTNGGVVSQNMPKGGGMTEVSSTVRYYNWRNQLNFNRTFNDKHAINLIAGTETSESITESTNEVDVFGYYHEDRLAVGRLPGGVDANTPMWFGTPLGYARYYYPINPIDVRAFGVGTQRLWSMYGNLSYTYDDKYSITASVRNDASNIVAPDSKYRYAPFWSVGGSWQLGKEDFLSSLDWLNRLTLRATVGEGGNYDPTLSFMTLMSVNSVADPYSNEITGDISSFGNPDLRWERTRTVNAGIDFAVFGSRFNGSVDVYSKRGLDLVIGQSISSVYGTTSQKLNNGEMLNKGIELRLGTALPIVGKNIQWFGNLNFAYNKNEITDLFKTAYGQLDLTGYYGSEAAYTEGKDANTIWAFDYAGVQNIGTEADPYMAPVIHGADGDYYPLTTWAPGTDARQYMSAQGTKVPPYIVGFQNSFKIYDFNLSFMFTGKFGHKYLRHGFNYTPAMSGNAFANNKFSEVKNGDPMEIVPIPENEMRYYFYSWYTPYMSYLAESASHIRFQELNLTYNVPKRLVTKIGLEGVQVYAQGNNLGTIVFNGFDEDPEYRMGTIKPQATYTFGLKVNL